VQCKVVYYGPARSGKTAHLRSIHANTPERIRGSLTTIATDTDRTLFFDFMPLELGDVAGVRTRVHLYGIPYIDNQNSLRTLVLQGADGVVFVADSRRDRIEANVEALENLRENLRLLGREPAEVPLVFAWNKSDAEDAMDAAALGRALNPAGLPAFTSCATEGRSALHPLKSVTHTVLIDVAKQMNAAPRPSAEAPAEAELAGEVHIEVEAAGEAPELDVPAPVAPVIADAPVTAVAPAAPTAPARVPLPPIRPVRRDDDENDDDEAVAVPDALPPMEPREAMPAAAELAAEAASWNPRDLLEREPETEPEPAAESAPERDPVFTGFSEDLGPPIHEHDHEHDVEQEPAHAELDAPVPAAMPAFRTGAPSAPTAFGGRRAKSRPSRAQPEPPEFVSPVDDTPPRTANRFVTVGGGGAARTGGPGYNHSWDTPPVEAPIHLDRDARPVVDRRQRPRLEDASHVSDGQLAAGAMVTLIALSAIGYMIHALL
jgi:signal recognition particle receptor subunit beta